MAETRDPGLSPTAMPIADAARVLSRIGGRPVSEQMLRADVAQGAPANADGTINLVHYAAWLAKNVAKEMAHAD